MPKTHCGSQDLGFRFEIYLNACGGTHHNRGTFPGNRLRLSPEVSGKKGDINYLFKRTDRGGIP